MKGSVLEAIMSLFRKMPKNVTKHKRDFGAKCLYCSQAFQGRDCGTEDEVAMKPVDGLTIEIFKSIRLPTCKEKVLSAEEAQKS